MASPESGAVHEPVPSSVAAVPDVSGTDPGGTNAGAMNAGAMNKDALIERFATLGRQLSQATVFFHAQIAEHVGLSATDHKCLDLAMQAERPLTAGQIAELSGLSTGAVTGVIDRLERAGFVRRVRDPHDRRKVLVEVSKGSLTRYGDAYDGLWSAMDQSIADYTDDQLAAIERWTRSMVATLRSEAERLAAGRRPTG